MIRREEGGDNYLVEGKNGVRKMGSWVRTVKDWPYSSFHRLVAAGIYTLEWTGDISEAFEVGELDD